MSSTLYPSSGRAPDAGGGAGGTEKKRRAAGSVKPRPGPRTGDGMPLTASRMAFAARSRAKTWRYMSTATTAANNNQRNKSRNPPLVAVGCCEGKGAGVKQPSVSAGPGPAAAGGEAETPDPGPPPPLSSGPLGANRQAWSIQGIGTGMRCDSIRRGVGWWALSQRVEKHGVNKELLKIKIQQQIEEKVRDESRPEYPSLSSRYVPGKLSSS